MVPPTAIRIVLRREALSLPRESITRFANNEPTRPPMVNMAVTRLKAKSFIGMQVGREEGVGIVAGP
jgi:hypothetical protein